MIAEDYKITPYDAWSICTALKLHFSEGTYDAFKFNFKTSATPSSFNSRRDRFYYEKVSRQYSKRRACIEYFLSNIISGKTWIGDMSGENYTQWQSKMQSLQYLFKSQVIECKKYCENNHLSFDDLFQSNKDLPPFFKLYVSEKLSIESLCIFDILCGYNRHINKIESDPMGVLKEVSHKVNRYKPFLIDKINKQKYKEIVINVFTNL